jgi:hypothetical protein
VIALLFPGVVRAQSVAVDVVILVDTSATMSDELDRLCAKLRDTLDSIRASGLSVRARVVSLTERSKCTDDTVRRLIKNSTVADDEDWGIGVIELVKGYDWQGSATRLIIVVSDAGPASGNPIEDPGPDRDVTTRMIQAAAENKVILSPLIGGPNPDVSATDRSRLERLARDMAAATGGRVFVSRSSTEVPAAISRLITAAVETVAGLTAIAAAIPTPGKISLDAGVLLTNIVLAVSLAVLFALTTVLATEAFGGVHRFSLPSNRVTDAVGHFARRMDRSLDVIATPSAWPIGNAAVRRIAMIVILTALLALTALIASFIDPDFKPGSPQGTTTTITLLIAFAVVTLAAAVGGWLPARSMQASSGLRVRPSAILIVAASVLLSRSLNFLPGFLIGLPAGFALLAAEEIAERDVRIGRASIIAAIVIGLIAWLLSWPVDVLLTRLADSLNSGAASVALTFAGGVQSALLTIWLIAIQFALIYLLPIGALTGRVWLSQRWLAWGIVFGVVMFAALHTLFNPTLIGLDALSHPGLLPLGAILAAYSGITLVAWLLTNESRIRAQQGLNRRSTLVAAVLLLAWLGGCACLGVSALASTVTATTVLVVAAIAGVVGVGVWGFVRVRASTNKQRINE